MSASSEENETTTTTTTNEDTAPKPSMKERIQTVAYHSATPCVVAIVSALGFGGIRFVVDASFLALLSLQSVRDPHEHLFTVWIAYAALSLMDGIVGPVMSLVLAQYYIFEYVFLWWMMRMSFEDHKTCVLEAFRNPSDFSRKFKNLLNRH